MTKLLLENAIELLKKVKLQINKSETRTHAAVDQAIKMIEERLALPADNKLLAYYLLYILDDVLKHLPSISAFISSLHSA